MKKNEFDYDPPENIFVIYKGLKSGGEWTNISLYFSDDEGKGRLDFGFWIEDCVDKTLRSNLKTELHNVAGGNKCNGPEETAEEGGCFWVYCTITVANDSTVDWLTSIMEELGRHALFMINQ